MAEQVLVQGLHSHAVVVVVVADTTSGAAVVGLCQAHNACCPLRLQCCGARHMSMVWLPQHWGLTVRKHITRVCLVPTVPFMSPFRAHVCALYASRCHA